MDDVNDEGIKVMKNIPPELWDDTEFILKAIHRSLLSLLFINEEKLMMPELTVEKKLKFDDINHKDRRIKRKNLYNR